MFAYEASQLCVACPALQTNACRCCLALHRWSLQCGPQLVIEMRQENSQHNISLGYVHWHGLYVSTSMNLPYVRSTADLEQCVRQTPSRSWPKRWPSLVANVPRANVCHGATQRWWLCNFLSARRSRPSSRRGASLFIHQGS